MQPLDTTLVDAGCNASWADAAEYRGASASAKQLRSQVLMVSPEHFRVCYAINPWMTGRVPVDVRRACGQWDRLRDCIAESADVYTLPGNIRVPDMCFSANAGLVAGKIFVPSIFRHAERQPESALFEAAMRQAGFAIRHLPSPTVFEGAGDALFDQQGRLWMGYGQRSSAAAAAQLCGMLGTQVIPLRLKDERFYHLDTCFCPLRSGHFVFYPEAFSAPSLATLERFIPPRLRIAVAREDAVNFACNMVDLGDKVIVHGASATLCAQLAAIGYGVRTVELGEFIKAGGGAKCLTLTVG